MRTQKTTSLALCLLAATALGACGEEETSETPAASAAPAEPATPEPGGELHVDYGFIGFSDADVPLGAALAYVEDDRLRLQLVSDTLEGVECGHDFGLGHDVGDGQLAVEVETHGYRHEVPFDGTAGTYEHVGYTFFYRRDGFDRGTNSGNSARDDLDTALTIERIDDEIVQGSIRLRDDVTGSFVARVCPDA
ncbi:MAG TPA: hypothetical protein RMH99_14860 [Sandaracinaceae bacterium LLY-WYZ-13_1]|nr:hypothetical protein [Sandaracinaceae bacterium LLY-WYZ-13_1]